MLIADTVGLHVDLSANTTIGVGYSREFLTEYVVVAFSTTPIRTTLRIRGIDTAEAASTLVERAVYVRPENITQQDSDRFTIADIEVCTVIDETRGALGTVTEVMLLPANDVWFVTTPDGRTIPLPVIDDVILKVDVASKTINVRLIPGLDELDTSGPMENDDE